MDPILKTQRKENWKFFPICFDFPAGHLNDNRCIKFGVVSVLEITEYGVSLAQ